MPATNTRRRAIARLSNDELNLLRKHSTPRSLAHRAAGEVALVRRTLHPQQGWPLHQHLTYACEVLAEMKSTDGDALRDLCDALAQRLARCAEQVRDLTP